MIPVVAFGDHIEKAIKFTILHLQWDADGVKSLDA